MMRELSSRTLAGIRARREAGGLAATRDAGGARTRARHTLLIPGAGDHLAASAAEGRLARGDVAQARYGAIRAALHLVGATRVLAHFADAFVVRPASMTLAAP